MLLIAFEEALDRTLEGVTRLGVESVPLDECVGRWLAGTVMAPRSMPEFEHSAMDGYALDEGLLHGDGPWTLEIHGESRAGGEAPPCLAGTACRIFTGAAIPAGANAVVMQEDVVRTGTSLLLPAGRRPRAGQNVRKRGEDLAEGAPALLDGMRVTPALIGLAAALDLTALPVARRPKVAILATGDELRKPGSPARPGTIPESNVHVVGAIARAVGADTVALPYASDTSAALTSALEGARVGCDLLVTIGGASVGDHDLVRPCLEALGARFAFSGVSMRPGKPTALASLAETRILCLPGNPASATLAFHLFGVPLLRALQGDRAPRPRTLALPVRGNHQRKLGGHCDGRDDFLRASLEVEGGELVARLAARQASGAVVSFAHASALVRLSGTKERIEEGERMPTLLLSELGG